MFIVSDRATNIYQLENIIRNLMVQVKMILKRSTNRVELKEIIGLLETMSATGVEDFIGSRVRIIADNRTNRILIKGDPDSRKRLRHTIEMLDAIGRPFGWFEVFRLKYASAKFWLRSCKDW